MRKLQGFRLFACLCLLLLSDPVAAAPSPCLDLLTPAASPVRILLVQPKYPPTPMDQHFLAITPPPRRDLFQWHQAQVPAEPYWEALGALTDRFPKEGTLLFLATFENLRTHPSVLGKGKFIPGSDGEFWIEREEDYLGFEHVQRSTPNEMELLKHGLGGERGIVEAGDFMAMTQEQILLRTPVYRGGTNSLCCGSEFDLAIDDLYQAATAHGLHVSHIVMRHTHPFAAYFSLDGSPFHTGDLSTSDCLLAHRSSFSASRGVPMTAKAITPEGVTYSVTFQEGEPLGPGSPLL